jgi:hypothetical protein
MPWKFSIEVTSISIKGKLSVRGYQKDAHDDIMPGNAYLSLILFGD